MASAYKADAQDSKKRNAMTPTRKGCVRIATVSRYAKRSGKEIENESEGGEVEEMKTYICDPSKCQACRKTACQDLCFHTVHKAQRAMGLKWLKYAWAYFGSEIIQRKRMREGRRA